MQIIHRYFKNLSIQQIKQFELLGDFYKTWNERINVISRKDIESLYKRHILHSLAIAAAFQLPDNCSVTDVGTGGGFPGIPLAIFFPNVKFHLIDSIGKKISVVQEAIKELGLQNCTAQKIRSTELKQKSDIIVSRAVTNIVEFVVQTRHLLNANSLAKPKGIIYLKGGDYTNEINLLNRKFDAIPVSNFFTEEFFETKYILHIR